jgi:hypothetical protein
MDFTKLTPEEDKALTDLVKREMDRPALEQAAKDAQSVYNDAYSRWMAERDVAQAAANEAITTINLAYQPELAAKQAAMEEAKSALTTTAKA